jgi:signal transduction histidine kinase
MRIKKKLQLGIGLLFLLNLLVGFLSLIYFNKLSHDTKSILSANYKTLNLTNELSQVLHQKVGWSATQSARFKALLGDQSKTNTPISEELLTGEIMDRFEQLSGLRNTDSVETFKAAIQQKLDRINQINIQSIYNKNIKTQKTLNEVKLTLTLITVFCLLIGFSFMINFPGYISNPLADLIEGIKGITEKKYNQRLTIRTGDEFGDVASAFNRMAGKLNEYESSNLAKVLFEKQRIETIIDQMRDVIIGFDDTNHIQFINKTGLQLLNIPEAELIGKYAPEAAMQHSILHTIMSKDENREVPITTTAGDRFFTKDIVDVNYQGKELGKVIVLKNITTFHELDEAKTNFIATISHELKTPISSIKLSLKLLEDSRVGEINDEQRSLLKNIKEDSNRLLKITGELLDLSQVESGNINLNIQETDALAIVNYAAQTVQFQAKQKQVSIKIMAGNYLPTILADEEKTAWVLVNLLSNALRYSPELSEIIVNLKQIEKQVEFSVKDQGPGIEAKYQEKIFNRYFQVPSSSKAKSGTGLGLAISKDFIEAQKGKIFIESTMGNGSCFSFMLPVSPQKL